MIPKFTSRQDVSGIQKLTFWTTLFLAALFACIAVFA